ncbi:MAG TPA: helix-turn-helix domain-containing protein [Microvirga sp.]|nr:helix-turn-helix domain-containing protein [Microvirga sp.]
METCAVDERMRFVLAVERRDEPLAAVCRRFRVSRRIGYKWLDRYREEGVAGLADRSRAPRHHPRAVSAAIAEHCRAVRRAHPTWGPVKVRAFLEDRVPGSGVARVVTVVSGIGPERSVCQGWRLSNLMSGLSSLGWSSELSQLM